MNYAAGGDYSSKAIHLALVTLDKVERWRIVSLADPPQQYLNELRAILAVWRTIAGPPGLRLYLEDPWARVETGIRTAINIHRPAAYLEAMAYLEAVEPVRVPVAVWRRGILGYSPRSAVAKRAVLDYVRRVYGLDTNDHNLADAVGIGTYGVAAGRLAEAAKRAGVP